MEMQVDIGNQPQLQQPQTQQVVVPVKKITLEDVVARKAELKKQLGEQKTLIKNIGKSIYAPQTKTNILFRSFNTGFAIFEGALLGLSTIYRLRRAIRRK